MIIEWLKNWILDMRIAKADVTKIVSSALDTIDEDDDGYISVREFIKIFRKIADDLHD